MRACSQKLINKNVSIRFPLTLVHFTCDAARTTDLTEIGGVFLLHPFQLP